MTANELRVGNIVYNPTLKEIKVIDYLDIRDLAESRLLHEFEPIRLNDEWLEKLWFENWDKNKWIDSNSVLTISKNGDNFLCLFNQRHIDIFHVHQLQNLYFALTGKELTIKTN